MQWVNDYMQENNCSKKEAKQAFKNEFGYKVPASIGMKILGMATGGFAIEKEKS